MGLVLGLSMTSKDIRGVLVDGVTGEGEPVDRVALDVPELDAFDAEALLKTLLVDGDLHAVGLTWSQDAEPAAIKIREALEVLSAGAPVVAVPDVEAAEALARGIADITEHDFLVVCIVEPDAAFIATVDGFRVEVDRVNGADSATLIDRARAVVRSAHPSPDAIFVLGSADIQGLVSALTDASPRPVITATDAGFALTRGTALASAQAINVPDAPIEKPRISRVGIFSSTLAGAVVVFVVSVALLLGLRLTADPADPPPHSTAAGPPVSAPAPPPKARDTPALRLDREPLASAAPPAPEAAPPPAPAYVPPAAPPVPEAAPPPAPAYIPPAAPVYVPPPPPVYAPPAPPPKPRLRDRILDKIPLINRLG